jgi:hypothetical protein
MRRSVFGLLIVVLFAVELAVAGEADKTVYFGGTANLQAGKESILDISDASVVRFADWQIPYSKITALGYGTRAYYNWDYRGAALLGLYGFVPPLLIKSRDHYLTVAYIDEEGKPGVAYFKVGQKSIARVFKALEARSGKNIQYVNEKPGKNGQQTSSTPQVELSDEESSSRQNR